VQMGVDGAYRGRVMALYVLVFLGTTPIGASAVGWWGDHFGVPSSIWGAGLVCFVAAVAALVWQLRVSGDRIALRVRPRPSVRIVRRVCDEAPAEVPVVAVPDAHPLVSEAGGGAPVPAVISDDEDEPVLSSRR